MTHLFGYLAIGFGIFLFVTVLSAAWLGRGGVAPSRREIPTHVAIAFALDEITDHLEREEFLRMWQHGEYDEIVRTWPEITAGQVVRFADHPVWVAA